MSQDSQLFSKEPNRYMASKKAILSVSEAVNQVVMDFICDWKCNFIKLHVNSPNYFRMPMVLSFF